MNFQANLEAFEGPLDLLLHLIDKNKVDIYDIPISLICDQYMQYMNSMFEDASRIDAQADTLSEFLVMAATLLDIKAKMLLPRLIDEEGNEEDPREELVQRLLEHKLYKFMSKELRSKGEAASHFMYKEKDIPREVEKYQAPIDLDSFMGDVNLFDLERAFKVVLVRNHEKINEKALQAGTIHREEVNIDERMEHILSCVDSLGEISFFALFEDVIFKINLIVTFLALLELMKLGKVNAKMNDKKEILICKAKN